MDEDEDADGDDEDDGDGQAAAETVSFRFVRLKLTCNCQQSDTGGDSEEEEREEKQSERLRTGEYKGILSLLRILKDGFRVKRQVLSRRGTVGVLMSYRSTTQWICVAMCTIFEMP